MQLKYCVIAVSCDLRIQEVKWSEFKVLAQKRPVFPSQSFSQSETSITVRNRLHSYFQRNLVHQGLRKKHYISYHWIKLTVTSLPPLSNWSPEKRGQLDTTSLRGHKRTEEKDLILLYRVLPRRSLWITALEWREIQKRQLIFKNQLLQTHK